MALHKKLTCLVFLVALMGGVVAWLNSPFPTTRPLAPSPAPQQPLDTSDWKTYRNEDLGFAIKLPPRWETDYKIEMIETIGKGFGAVMFLKPSEWITVYTGKKVQHDYMVFSISAVTKEWWEKEMSYDQPRPGIIREINDRVYTYGIGHDTETLERKEIRAMLNTFEVIE